MRTFYIAPFEGKAEIPSCNADELTKSLLSLNKSGFAVPTLVNVYSDPDRIAIIGLGSAQSTVQLIDKLRGETHRSTLPAQAGDNLEFSYQGEATFVRPRFLIPVDLAVRAVVTWLAEYRLLADVAWLSGPCPPKLNQP